MPKKPSKARIEVAIEKMREKVATLEVGYVRTRELNEGAWNTCGSEFCAESMERAENDILGQKAELEIAIGIWEEALAGKDIETSKLGLKEKVRQANETIERNRAIVADCEADLKRIELAKSFLPK